MPVAGSAAISYTISNANPDTAAQLVEWHPQHLPSSQEQAVDTITALFLDINAQRFNAAWALTTGRSHGTSSARHAWSKGYRTTRFFQAAFGTPQTLASDLIAVPMRFVSRQDGAAQGDASIPPCVFWPQFVFLVGHRSAGWLVDNVQAYSGRSVVVALQRPLPNGISALNPRTQETTC